MKLLHGKHKTKLCHTTGRIVKIATTVRGATFRYTRITYVNVDALMISVTLTITRLTHCLESNVEIVGKDTK